jgi:hypothetical protein
MHDGGNPQFFLEFLLFCTLHSHRLELIVVADLSCSYCRAVLINTSGESNTNLMVFWDRLPSPSPEMGEETTIASRRAFLLLTMIACSFFIYIPTLDGIKENQQDY